MLNYVSSKSRISVQEFGPRKGLGPKDSIAPSNYSGQEAVEAFRDTKTWPINLLDLEAYKPNAQPWFLAQNESMQCMRTIEADNHAGKRSQTNPAELRNSTQFQLLGAAGVWSMPHCDSIIIMS